MENPVIQYAILNADGVCINRCLWDGVTAWQPPEGCTAVADPDNLHPIYVAPQPEPEVDLLASLTAEQKAALLTLLQQFPPNAQV
jgi:hypothetical protein